MAGKGQLSPIGAVKTQILILLCLNQVAESFKWLLSGQTVFVKQAELSAVKCPVAGGHGLCQAWNTATQPSACSSWSDVAISWPQGERYGAGPQRRTKVHRPGVPISWQFPGEVWVRSPRRAEKGESKIRGRGLAKDLSTVWQLKGRGGECAPALPPLPCPLRESHFPATPRWQES